MCFPKATIHLFRTACHKCSHQYCSIMQRYLVFWCHSFQIAVFDSQKKVMLICKPVRCDTPRPLFVGDLKVELANELRQELVNLDLVRPRDRKDQRMLWRTKFLGRMSRVQYTLNVETPLGNVNLQALCSCQYTSWARFLQKSCC